MKYFHCTVNDWDCPYYKNEIIIKGQKRTGVCTLEDPMSDCDDFFSMLCESVPDEYIPDNCMDDN